MSDPDPLDLPVQETLEALVPHLPPPPARLLEVGCGEGRLAAALAARGHAVRAVDADPTAVASARARGVDACVGAWPDVAPPGPFDVLLFTRSLHHVGDLESALEVARDALVAGGVLVVEDWAWEQVDDASAELTARLVDLARAAGWAVEDGWPAPGADPLEHWLRHLREHGLHPWRDQREALAARFSPRCEELQPYVYRYFCRFVADHPRGLEVARAALELERVLVNRGALGALGRLWVGTR